jgi:aminoglycoside phosphotransferase (APT) family kinase protein
VRAPNQTELAGVLDDVRQAGVRMENPRILHQGSSLVIGDGSLVVRITEEDIAQGEETIGRAHALGASRAPVLQPAHDRPLVTRLGTATVWPQGRSAPDAIRNLGKVLVGLHQVDDLVIPSRAQSRNGLRRRLRELSGIGVDENVLRRLMTIATRLPEEISWAGDIRTLVHGDAHTGNIIWYEGRVLLLDTSTVGMGEPLTDLVPAWCEARRGPRGKALWREFCDGYGEQADMLVEWPHLAEAVLERELLTTIFLAEQWQTRTWVREEIATRVESWDHFEDGPRWNTGE